MTDEQWPPNSGVPEKKRFKKARRLKWGETPFDDLTRAELLRLVQAYHSAAVSAGSVLSMAKESDPYSPFTGGAALAKIDHLLTLAGENDPDPASENIYRSFFRSANPLLFPYLKAQRFYNWGINDKGEMCAPYRAEEGFRPIEWRDVLPTST